MSGPLPAALAPLTVPASWAYGLVVAARNRRFARGRGVVRADRPVISVGNLTAGGTGKTPFVRWAATVLRAERHRPVIAHRGYGARDGNPSDETLEYGRALPEVAVLAQPDRAAALAAFLPGHPEVDCVLLDDGFQHRRLARALDLVLVDATRGLEHERLLPAGCLREPLAALGRADAVVVTRAESIDAALSALVERHHGAAPIAWAQHGWTGLRVHERGDCRIEPVSWLSGRRVATMLGIGNPAAILAQLRTAGAELAAHLAVRDHAAYDHGRVEAARRAAEDAGALVVTMKDWVKLEDRVQSWSVPVVVPDLRLEFIAGEHALRERLLSVVHEIPRVPGAA